MRPVMDPMFHGDQHDDPNPGRRPRMPLWRVALSRGWRAVKWCVRCLFSKPLARRRAMFRVEDGPALSRMLKGVAYRALFAPLLIALTAGAFVFKGTHPLPLPAEGDPGTVGLYFDPVSFASRDGTPLQGWIVPTVSARQVLEKKEKLLRAKHPAVVLVHDFGQSPSDMLPMVSALHEDGFVQLVVGLRGTGTGTRRGQTFGLREADDVAAAVDMLRRRPFVDPERVAVVGVGTGATAALRAAASDANVRAMVLIDPAQDANELLAQGIGPQRFGLRWMQPICKWTFELSYGVDAEELNPKEYKETFHRPHLILDRDQPFADARPMLLKELATAPRQEAVTTTTLAR